MSEDETEGKCPLCGHKTDIYMAKIVFLWPDDPFEEEDEEMWSPAYKIKRCNYCFSFSGRAHSESRVPRKFQPNRKKKRR